MRDRLVQLVTALVVLLGGLACANLVPSILASAEKDGLRYTNDPLEGAPPIVALGNSIGALRSIIADYLWIKADKMKRDGEYYEASSLASWITKLQPRFAAVWAFHGHNLAYNMSVLTNTRAERWAWVNAGINLVRNQGLRYNPNDLGLNKELSFWFAHKIDGVSDDAHLYYKRELAREWQFLLGTPPYDMKERETWINRVADAADSYEELIAKEPKVKDLVARLTEDLSPFERVQFKLDKSFLMSYGQWLALRQSPTARILHMEETLKMRDPVYLALDKVLSDQENRKAVGALIAYLRKKVLRDDYNMDARVMARYTAEFGPLDWRHPQAHALYWARIGSENGGERYNDVEDIYNQMNNDRIWIQAIQALSRTGLMDYDPFGNDNPTRLNDSRWIKPLDRYFHELYKKYYSRARGGGPDTFADLHENFMTDWVRQLYRQGDIEGAQEILTELDRLYGTTGIRPSTKYQRPLDVFVKETTEKEYEYVPDTARTDVYASLRYGFIEGYLRENAKALESARTFAKEVTEFYKSTNYFNFVNKFGEGRMKDLIGSLVRSEEEVFIALMRDTSMSLLDRLTIYHNAPDEIKRLAYDDVKDQITTEMSESPIGRTAYEHTLVIPGKTNEDAAKAVQQVITEFFPEPPGMEEWRQVKAQRAKEKERQKTGPQGDFQIK